MQQVFHLRSLSARKIPCMRIRVALIAAISVFSLLINGNSPSFAAQPRKILTGWIPYYQMKTSLPSALTNSDLVKEVMPFWFTLNLNGNKSSIVDLYTPANPSIPMASPLNNLRAANFKIIPTITDGTTKLALANYLSTPTNRTYLVSSIVNLVLLNGCSTETLVLSALIFIFKSFGEPNNNVPAFI